MSTSFTVTFTPPSAEERIVVQITRPSASAVVAVTDKAKGIYKCTASSKHPPSSVVDTYEIGELSVSDTIVVTFAGPVEHDKVRCGIGVLDVDDAANWTFPEKVWL